MSNTTETRLTQAETEDDCLYFCLTAQLVNGKFIPKKH